MTASLLDWFVKVPALWTATGFVCGGIITATIAVLLFRRYGEQLVEINDKIIKQQDKQIEMAERTLHMQKEHYEAEAQETKRHYEAALAEVKAEWQNCRKTLHDKRQEWNAESVKLQLLIQELEARPDMTKLNLALVDVVSSISKVAVSLEKHDRSVDTRMKSFLTELKKVVKK